MPKGMGGEPVPNIAHYLRGIEFPATKVEIIERAEENNAPEELLDALEDLPDIDFSSMADLMQGIGKVE